MYKPAYEVAHCQKSRDHAAGSQTSAHAFLATRFRSSNQKSISARSHLTPSDTSRHRTGCSCSRSHQTHSDTCRSRKGYSCSPQTQSGTSQQDRPGSWTRVSSLRPSDTIRQRKGCMHLFLPQNENQGKDKSTSHCVSSTRSPTLHMHQTA